MLAKCEWCVVHVSVLACVCIHLTAPCAPVLFGLKPLMCDARAMACTRVRVFRQIGLAWRALTTLCDLVSTHAGLLLLGLAFACGWL